MPSWLLGILIHLGVWIVERYGVPYLEAAYPKLAPLLDEILAIIKAKGKALPSDALKTCSHGYCSQIAIPTPLQK